LFCVIPGELNEMELFWESEISDLFQTLRLNGEVSITKLVLKLSAVIKRKWI
jgi:hypothetical protein